MYKLFYKYKPAILTGFILISLLIANFTVGSIKDFFIGMSTGAALISFGQSLRELKAKNEIKNYDEPLANE
jgi:hypothetical protein